MASSSTSVTTNIRTTSSDDYDPNIRTQWQQWKEKQPGQLKIVHLLEGNQATIFVRMCQSLIDEKTFEAPRHILALFNNGETECGHKRVILWAKDANQILQYGLNKHKSLGKENNFYGLIHAVCPHVLDCLSLMDDSVIECYYKDNASNHHLFYCFRIKQ